MKRALTLSLLVALPNIALACGGGKTADATQNDPSVQLASAALNPTHCAKQDGLVGSNCSYSTGMMAQRVLEEGTPYSFTGSLASAANDLDSKVAAPYAIGPNNGINVVANSILESVVDGGSVASRLEIVGRLLEVDGVQYLVATSMSAINAS